MIIISYYSHYSKPTVQTKNISREEKIRRYNEAMARKEQLSLITTTTTNSITISYKTAFYLLFGGALVGLGLLIYTVGYKSGKAKYKYRYKS